jgi:hypothetical protein
VNLHAIDTNLHVKAAAHCLIATVDHGQQINTRSDDGSKLKIPEQSRRPTIPTKNQIIMARSSGNIDANGGVISDTSNKNGFTVEPHPQGTGHYRIRFSKPFQQLPTVFVNVINWDAETDANDINVGVVPHNDYVDIELWRNNNYANHSLSFAAFGDV